jgi:hypothetical protein
LPPSTIEIISHASPSTTETPYGLGISAHSNTTGSPRTGFVRVELLAGDSVVSHVDITVNQSPDVPCTTPVSVDLPDTLTLTTNSLPTPCGDGDGPGNAAFALTKSGTTYASGDGAWQGYYGGSTWVFDYTDPISEEVLVSFYVPADTSDCSPQLGDMLWNEGQCGDEESTYAVLS